MVQVTVGNFDYEALTDVDTADEHLGADVSRATAWALRNTDTKGRGLVTATRNLLTLPWTEGNTPDPAAITAGDLTSVIQQVTAEYAADLLATPRLQSGGVGNSNIKIAKAGSAQVEFFTPIEGGPPIPLDLWSKLQAAGLVGSLDGYSDLDATLDAAQPFGTCGSSRPLDGRPTWDYTIAAEDLD